MQPFAIAGLQLQIHGGQDNLPYIRARLAYLMGLFPWDGGTARRDGVTEDRDRVGTLGGARLRLGPASTLQVPRFGG